MFILAIPAFIFWNGKLECEAAFYCYIKRGWGWRSTMREINGKLAPKKEPLTTTFFCMISSQTQTNKEHKQHFVWHLCDCFTLSCLRTRSMKNFQQFSLVSISPEPRTSGLTLPMMFSNSSSGNRSGISPWMNERTLINAGTSTKIVANRRFSLRFFCLSLTCKRMLQNFLISLGSELTPRLVYPI